MEEKRKVLIGMEAIGDYCDRSPKTIKKLVVENNFPAMKICGRWESNKDLIDLWQRNMVAKYCEAAAA